jgi:hypothetical protein
MGQALSGTMHSMWQQPGGALIVRSCLVVQAPAGASRGSSWLWWQLGTA